MARKRQRRGHGEGSIYQRKDGRWTASLTLEDGKRKSFYGKSYKEVEEKLRVARNEQKQGTLATGPQQTLKSYLWYCLEDVHKHRIRIGTYEEYRTILNKHLLPTLGHIQLQKLTTQQVQSLIAKKSQEGLSAGRVRHIHAVLHKALDHAVRIKLVHHNVCDMVELPHEKQREIQLLAPEQAQQLLKKVREHRLEGLLTLALATGMRKGEMLSLRWQDIDLYKGSLHIHRTVSYVAGRGFVEGEPKTARSRRTIALPDFVVEALKRHRTLQLETRLQAGPAWVDNNLVFCNPHGEFIHPMTLFRHFTKLLREVGLPHMRFHDLRHSAATILLSMGVPMKVVQELLGHSNFGTTANIYSHVLPGMQKEAMDKMNDLFRRQDDDEEIRG